MNKILGIITRMTLGFFYAHVELYYMLVIGCFIDFIMYIKIIPVCNNLYTGVFMMIASMFVSAIGSYLYIGCEMGCGPRDGLMVALMKITGKSVSIIRLCSNSF